MTKKEMLELLVSEFKAGFKSLLIRCSGLNLSVHSFPRPEVGMDNKTQLPAVSKQ